MRFHTRLKHALQQQHPQLFIQIPLAVWSLDWVADVQPVGTGEPALKYLAAYVYRTVFSAELILADDGQGITFNYKDSKDHSRGTVRLTAEQFLHRIAPFYCWGMAHDCSKARAVQAVSQVENRLRRQSLALKAMLDSQLEERVEAGTLLLPNSITQLVAASN